MLLSIFFLFHASLFHNNSVLNTGVDVLCLFFSLLDLIHQALKVDRNVFAVDVNLLDHTLMYLLPTDVLHSFLPCQCLLDLLLQNDHLLCNVTIAFLFLKHLKKLTHFQFFVDRNVLASFIISSLDIALLFDLLGELYRSSNLVFDIRRCLYLELLQDGQMILKLVLTYPAV